MSFAIQDTDVSAVLLADGWHEVVPNTFFVDAFEFLMNKKLLVHNGGTGFWFQPVDGPPISGPMVSVIAVKVGKE